MATPPVKSLYPDLKALAPADCGAGKPSATAAASTRDTLTVASGGSSASLYPRLPLLLPQGPVSYPVLPSAPPASDISPMEAACQPRVIPAPQSLASYLQYGHTVDTAVPAYTQEGHKGLLRLVGISGLYQKEFSAIKKISEEDRFGAFNPLDPTSHPELHDIINAIAKDTYDKRNLMDLDRLLVECNEIIRTLDHKAFPNEHRGLVEVALRRAMAQKIIAERLPTWINSGPSGGVIFSSNLFNVINSIHAFVTRDDHFGLAYGKLLTDLRIPLLITNGLTDAFVQATAKRHQDGDLELSDIDAQIAVFEAGLRRSLDLCPNGVSKDILVYTVLDDAKDKVIAALTRNIATATSTEINATHSTPLFLGRDLTELLILSQRHRKPQPILECLKAIFEGVTDDADKTLDKKIAYFQNALAVCSTSSDQEPVLRGLFLHALMLESLDKFKGTFLLTSQLPVDWRETMVKIFEFGTKGNSVPLPFHVNFQNYFLSPLCDALEIVAKTRIQERQISLGESREVSLQDKINIYERCINESVQKHADSTPDATRDLCSNILQHFLRANLSFRLAREWASKNANELANFNTTGYLPESVYFDAQFLQNLLTCNGKFTQVNDFFRGKLATLFGDIAAVEAAIAVNTGKDSASTSAAEKALLAVQRSTLTWVRSMLDPSTTSFSPPPAIARGATNTVAIPSAAVVTPAPVGVSTSAAAVLTPPVAARPTAAVTTATPTPAPVVLSEVNFTSELTSGVDFSSPTWYRDLPVQHKIFTLGNILSRRTGVLEERTTGYLTAQNPGRLIGPFACTVQDLALEEVRANEAAFLATLTSAEKRSAGEALLAYLLIERPYMMRTIDKLKAAGLDSHGPFLESIYVQAIREGQIIEAWDTDWAKYHWEADARSTPRFYDRIIQGLERFIAS